MLVRDRRQLDECQIGCLRLAIDFRLSRVGKPSPQTQFNKGESGFPLIFEYYLSIGELYKACLGGCESEPETGSGDVSTPDPPQ